LWLQTTLVLGTSYGYRLNLRQIGVYWNDYSDQQDNNQMNDTGNTGNNVNNNNPTDDNNSNQGNQSISGNQLCTYRK
jgi:hypothetical protein